jgi:hypothetical protein
LDVVGMDAMSAVPWNDEEHGVSYEDLATACEEYAELITRAVTLVKNWKATGDNNLIEVLDYLLQDYDLDSYDFEDIELEDDDGTRH